MADNIIQLPLFGQQRDESRRQRGESRQRRIERIKEDNWRGDVFLRRQDEMIDDPFREIYTRYALIMPPHNFARLMDIYTESGILQTCVAAMRDNIHAFGYELQYLGKDQTERDEPEAEKSRVALENFFDEINPEESFRDVRKQWCIDFEVLGNGALEVIRNELGEILYIYHMPLTYLRMTTLHPDHVLVPVKIMRDGKLVERSAVKQKFRRYALINPYTHSIRWFKSFGDPRDMDIDTGEFAGRVMPDGTFKGKKLPDEKRATELIWTRNQVTNSNYGLPRWIGNTYSVLGKTNAEFVNYDVFENRGIPPFYVAVSGGVLTDESIAEIEVMLDSLRGVDQFNRVPIIEAEPASGGFEERAGSVKIEIKSLLEHMQNDVMFHQYMEDADKSVRTRFRLPPIYTGASDDYTRATALSSQNTAEEQVFIPARDDFDSMVNKKIIQGEFGIRDWKYKSMGPQIVGADEIAQNVRIFSNVGAFSINHAIKLANRAFGLQMSEYTQEWAKWPIPMVLKVLEKGVLKDVEIAEIQNATNQALAPDGGNPVKNLQKGDPAPDLFNSVEALDSNTKGMYLQLLSIQNWMEKYGLHDVTEEDTEL